MSEKIQLKLTASRGIIRLAFKEANLDPDAYSYENYKKVFNHYLKERLERAGIDNAEEIVRHMISELIRNQSFFIVGI
ncbi:MAG: hypothetical protein ACFFAS_18350 [Promethearchaeota archaeon]